MIKTHSLILSAVIASLFSMPPAWAAGTDSRMKNPSAPSHGSGTLNPNLSINTPPVVRRLEIVQAKFERGFGAPGSQVALRVSVRNHGASSAAGIVRVSVKRNGGRGTTQHTIPMPSIGTVAMHSLDTLLPECSLSVLGDCLKAAEGRHCYRISLTGVAFVRPKIETGPSKQACILVSTSPPVQK